MGKTRGDRHGGGGGTGKSETIHKRTEPVCSTVEQWGIFLTLNSPTEKSSVTAKLDTSLLIRSRHPPNTTLFQLTFKAVHRRLLVQNPWNEWTVFAQGAAC